MTKRLVSLALIAILALACLPAVSSAKAEYTRWVYTENGKSLNVRSEPATGIPPGGSLPAPGHGRVPDRFPQPVRFLFGIAFQQAWKLIRPISFSVLHASNTL